MVITSAVAALRGLVGLTLAPLTGVPAPTWSNAAIRLWSGRANHLHRRRLRRCDACQRSFV